MIFDPLIVPIPIREDATVQIAGLPLDLTQVEAAKIAAVVMAFAAEPEPKDQPHER